MVEFQETPDGMIVLYEYPTGRAMLYPKTRFEEKFGPERDIEALKQLASDDPLWTAIFAEAELAAAASE